MKSFLNIIILSFFTIYTPCLYTQELPPIKEYTAEDYQGDNQNWMISQDSKKFIYVAIVEGYLSLMVQNGKFTLHLTILLLELLM